MIAEGYRQRKGSTQTGQDICNSLLGAAAVFNEFRNKVRYDLAVRVAFQRTTCIAQFGAQFLEVLDDPVVNERYVLRSVWMGVLRGRRPVRCPARMSNADLARGRIVRQFRNEVVELAFGSAPNERALMYRTYPGAIVSAVFHPAQTIDEAFRHRFVADNTDNSTHGLHTPISAARRSLSGSYCAINWPY